MTSSPFLLFFFLLMHWKQKVSQDEEWETRFFSWQQTNPHSDHASHQVWLWGAVWQGVAHCTNTQPQLICQDVWGFITFLQQKDFNGDINDLSSRYSRNKQIDGVTLWFSVTRQTVKFPLYERKLFAYVGGWCPSEHLGICKICQ